MRRALVIVLVVLMALVLVPLVGGFMLPQAHVATRSAEFDVPPDSLWQLVTKVADYPAWRSGVTNVEVLVIRDRLPMWIESSSDGRVTYEAIEGEPGRRFVVRMDSAGMPYGGSWTYEFAPAGSGGTTLTITENGEVYNPIFRFLSRFVIGHTASLDQYLRDLAKWLVAGTPVPAGVARS